MIWSTTSSTGAWSSVKTGRPADHFTDVAGWPGSRSATAAQRASPVPELRDVGREVMPPSVGWLVPISMVLVIALDVDGVDVGKTSLIVDAITSTRRKSVFVRPALTTATPPG